MWGKAVRQAPLRLTTGAKMIMTCFGLHDAHVTPCKRPSARKAVSLREAFTGSVATIRAGYIALKGKLYRASYSEFMSMTSFPMERE